VSWDLIDPLPESHIYNAIITITDQSMKGLKLEPTTVSISMGEAARIMCNWLYSEEGLPSKVYSDRGPQFVGTFIKDLYWMLGTEGNSSIAYHLQMDGQTKRMNREVKQYLRMYVNYWQVDWAEWLPLTEFTYNNGVHEAKGQTPFFHGRHPHLHLHDVTPRGNLASEVFFEDLERVWAAAARALEKVKASMKEHWDRSKRPSEEYQQGDLVMVMRSHLPSTHPSAKLDDKWRGPYHVKEKVGPAAWRLEMLEDWKGHPVFNESRLKRYFETMFPDQPAYPHLPLILVNDRE
jgi:hypothetical protein